MKFIHRSVIKRQVVYLFVLLTFIFSFGCFHEFYKVQTASLEEFKETVNTAKIKKPEYFVLHYQDVVLHLTDVQLQDGHLMGNLAELPPEWDYDRDPRAYTEPVRYRPEEKSILQETHLFLNNEQAFSLETGPIELPLSAISEIHRYDKANEATIISHVVGVVGIAGTAMLIAVVAYESNGGGFSMNVPRDANGEISSCPIVYADNGQTYRLQGEAFAGAIFPSLERHDYLPLPDIQIVDNSYRVRLSNEQKELQHINMTELIVVEHPENTSAVLDQKGVSHTLTNLQEPLAAKASNGKEVTALLQYQDQEAYFFDEGEDLFNSVVLEFEKPKQAASTKLLLNTRESYWALMMMETFTSGLGTEYDSWIAQMGEQPAEAIYDILDKQGLRLGVYLWNNNTWQPVEKINNVGPIAFRDVVVPIDLSTHQDEVVRIKLEAGHLFWEVNHAAMDFTNDQDIVVHKLEPEFAKASDGKTYTKALAKNDQSYLDLEYGGNQVSIWYPAIPEKSGYQQSIFLHSKGHYEHLRDYDWPPEVIGMPQLDQPGSFIEFSNRHYEQYLEANRQVE